jgi:tetratricopeptide (TPR) repeat protein
MSHPTLPMLRTLFRALSVADAGLLLHLLECPRCSRRAWKELSPRPMRRRPGEPRPIPPAAPEAPPGPAAAAEICRALAAERREEGRFDEAVALLERSAALYDRAAQPQEQAAILGDLASLHLGLHQEEEVLATFERMLALAPVTADPGLATGRATGIAGLLAAGSDPLEGRRLLTALRERLGRRRVVHQRLAITRIEGLLAAFTRQEHQAEKLFRDTWVGYLRVGAAGHSVLVLTDLAVLLLRQGRTSGLRDLATEIRRWFRGRTLLPRAGADLDRLLESLETGQVSAELLTEIALDMESELAEPAPP